MDQIQAICFDLDDTLWDLPPVLRRAERELYAWYGRNYPAVTERFSAAEIRRMRTEIADEFPELLHDLTELRMKVLRRIAEQSGYPESMADEAFHIINRERNRVDLFADVLPALDLLAGRCRLFTLSNGNANLEAIGIARHFEMSFSAREIGVAKPNPEIFHAVCERSGLLPEQVVHVGDHPENDIVAARSVGMVTVWVNRQQTAWPEEWSEAHQTPDHVVGCLEEFAKLFES
jgi:putative hydrolase of the HAD superfamily